MNEIFKPIPGFERYQVSNLGNIKGIDGSLKKPYKDPNTGGLRVGLFDYYGDKYTKQVKLLVAEVFILNPENRRYVIHKDGNLDNNCVDNLEWSSDRKL